MPEPVPPRDAEALRPALAVVIRTVFLVAILTVIRTLSYKLPGMYTRILDLELGGYLYLALTAALVVFLVRAYRPASEVLAFYLPAALRVGKVPGREKLLPHAIGLGEALLSLVYLLALVAYLRPVVFIVNEWFLSWRAFPTVFGVIAVVLGVAILVQMWRHVSPLADLLSGKLTRATGGPARAACPACGAENVRDAKFCSSCGNDLAPPAPAPTSRCRTCGAPLPPGARFCSNCGGHLTQVS